MSETPRAKIRNAIIERDAGALKNLLPEIQSLGDSEKDNALGFLPARAFGDALDRGRLIAAVVYEGGSHRFAGYLLHSGVFPNAKVQQVAVLQNFERQVSHLA